MKRQKDLVCLSYNVPHLLITKAEQKGSLPNVYTWLQDHPADVKGFFYQEFLSGITPPLPEIPSKLLGKDSELTISPNQNHRKGNPEKRSTV